MTMHLDIGERLDVRTDAGRRELDDLVGRMAPGTCLPVWALAWLGEVSEAAARASLRRLGLRMCAGVWREEE